MERELVASKESSIAKLSLMLVVAVDVMGQGLLFPILNTLFLDSKTNFLPSDASKSLRSFDYGITIGAFFISWFLGSVYISKISDSIGRKKGIILCLLGTLFGYLITIQAIATSSFLLIIIGRIITGFTAGNQPIASAAMVDLSKTEASKIRNIGLIMTGISFGVILGPILGGLLSDQALLGDFASLSLPIYSAITLVLLTLLCVILFFQDVPSPRVPLRIKPQDIVLLLWEIRKYPSVMRISPVYFFSQWVSTTFWVFLANYLSLRFNLSTTGTSAGIFVFGAMIVLGSSFLLPTINKITSRKIIILSLIVIEMISTIVFISAPTVTLSFIAVAIFGISFSIRYATLLDIYSASVSSSEQGWVMGISIALFTMGGGLVSILGGRLIELGSRTPYYLSIIAALLALFFIFSLWRKSTSLYQIVSR